MINRKGILFMVIVLSLLFPSPIQAGWESGGVAPDKCDSIPPLNHKIVAFARAQIGATVGRGECWDLAAEALNVNQAEWDKKYKYGREVKPDRECIYPGDIIQFEGVRIKYQSGNRRYEETMSHHTAIIYKVKEKGYFVLAHQNTAFSGRKVGLSELRLETIVKGKIRIYRPER